ncbi:MAG: tetratricopeptide repeat protein [Hyphomicrobiaceae bacterium]
MLKDRYDNPLTTSSTGARDAYVAAVDALLSANIGGEEGCRAAIAADDGFALGHVTLARTLQMFGRGNEAKAPLARALELAPGTTPREQGHIEIFNRILTGRGAEALQLTHEHIKQWPRDAFALAPSTSVFGLIGFAGTPGREHDQLALLDPLQGAYGDDWWFRSQLAFAQMEDGDTARALPNIEASMAAFSRNAHGAHIRAHLYYEMGERVAGFDFLKDWSQGYSRLGQLHCHVTWHQALWAMELGHSGDAWAIYNDLLHPGSSWGPQINVLTDCASFLFRAELSGEPRQTQKWVELSGYAKRWFPNPGLAFADVHGALSHAMAGDDEAVVKIIEGAKGAAADVVAPVAQGFRAFARQDWQGAVAALEPHMVDHERLGGSRAQRDLVEYTMAVARLGAGQTEEARRQLMARRGAVERNGGFPLKEMRKAA